MITKGTMRRVFLTKNYAIKIPRFRNLLRGWIANKSEVHYYKESQCNPAVKDLLCPIFFPLSGWIIIQPRVKSVTEEEVSEIWDTVVNKNMFLFLILEPVLANFGKYNGRVVAIDYNVRCF